MELWTFKHLITLLPSMIIMLAISILVGYLLRNKSKNIKMIPIYVLIGLLILSEIGKQIFYISTNSWILYYIPLHYSSLCLFLGSAYIFYSWNKENKVARFFNSFFYTYLAVMFVFMCVYPNIVYSTDAIDGFFKDYGMFHQVFYHGLVIFIFFMMLTLNLIELHPKRDCLSLILGTLGYALIEAVVGNILKTNYNNLYYSGVGFVENIRLQLNDSLGFFGQLIYILAYTCVMLLFVFICYWAYKGIVLARDKIELKIKNKQENNI